MHLGEWLREARKAAGLSYAETTHRLRALPPPMWVSIETIRRMEKRADPDPILAGGLASVYGKTRDEMPPDLVRELDQVLSVLAGSSAKLDELRSGSSVGRARA